MVPPQFTAKAASQGPQQAPRALSGAPVAAYWALAVGQAAQEGIGRRHPLLPRTCRQVSDGDYPGLLGSVIAFGMGWVSTMYTLSLLIAKVKKEIAVFYVRHEVLCSGLGRDLHGVAVDREVGHLGPPVVGNVHGVEAGGAAGLQAAGLGQEHAPPGGGEEGDRHLLGDGHPGAVAVGSDGKGEIGQGEDGAPHGHRVGVEVDGADGHGAHGVAGLGHVDGHPGGLGGKAVAGKAGADLIQCGHRAGSSPVVVVVVVLEHLIQTGRQRLLVLQRASSAMFGRSNRPVHGN